MDARTTTPFTRMIGLARAYRSDRDMLAALEGRSPAGEHMLDRLLRALGSDDQPVAVHAAAKTPVA